MTDFIEHNRKSWNRLSQQGDRWTVPVDPQTIARAREGLVKIVLTPTKTIPQTWLGSVRGIDVLCLASGGGQQGPVLAAAGANVTVYDMSDAQLATDRAVAEREALTLQTIQGDMRVLDKLDDASFDLIIHPISNCFVDDVTAVWREAFRVLRPGGKLLSGFMNPIAYCHDWDLYDERGIIELKHAVPYADTRDLPNKKRQELIDNQEPLEFGHSLEDQIGGQLLAGFHLIGLYEDRDIHDQLDRTIDAMYPRFMATCALKPT